MEPHSNHPGGGRRHRRFVQSLIYTGWWILKAASGSKPGLSDRWMCSLKQRPRNLIAEPRLKRVKGYCKARGQEDVQQCDRRAQCGAVGLDALQKCQQAERHADRRAWASCFALRRGLFPGPQGQPGNFHSQFCRNELFDDFEGQSWPGSRGRFLTNSGLLSQDYNTSLASSSPARFIAGMFKTFESQVSSSDVGVEAV